MLKPKKQLYKQLHKACSNQGVSIIMVIIAMSFVGVLLSIVMLAALYNFYMKGVDRRAKDTFYSAETALEEVRAGIQRQVSLAFSASYMSILQDYGRADTGRDEKFAQMYTDDLFLKLGDADDSDNFKEETLRNFITHLRTGEDTNDQGAWLEKDANIEKSLQRYTDGIRLKGIKVSYIDENGYISYINTDFLIKIPDLNLGRPGDVPDILNYCLIANEKLDVDPDQIDVSLEGSVYGGQNGISIGYASKLDFARASFQNTGMTKYTTIFVSTDGNIEVGRSTASGEGTSSKLPATLTVSGSSGQGVSLWASGINLYGNSGDDPNCNIYGDVYLQDDLTIEGHNNFVKLAGNFCGYGNADKKAGDSSSIVINGRNTVLDLRELNTLELAGNSFISIERPIQANAESGVLGEPSDNAANIKTGNSAASKAEQLAYLVPSELVGIDREGNNSLKKNPVPYSEYAGFKNLISGNSDRYKEVDFSLGNDFLREPLSNYGVSFERVFHRAASSVWVYYYLKFNSAYNANRFFQDYYSKNSQYLSSYIANYISDIKMNPALLEGGNSGLYLAGNMLVKEGSSYLLHPASNVSVDEVNIRNTKYAEYGQKFQALTHILNDNAYALSSAQLNRSVFDNLIKRDLFESLIPKNRTGVYFKDTVTEGDVETEQNMALLVRLDPTDAPFKLDKAFFRNANNEHLHLIVVDGDVEIGDKDDSQRRSEEISFKGIIIASGTVTIHAKTTLSAYENIYNKMANCFLATSDSFAVAGEEHAAVYFFRQGQEAIEDDDGDDENQTITASDLIVPENWVKY